MSDIEDVVEGGSVVMKDLQVDPGMLTVPEGFPGTIAFSQPLVFQISIIDRILPGWLVEGKTQTPEGEVIHYLGLDRKTGVYRWSPDKDLAFRASMRCDALAFSKAYQALMAPTRPGQFNFVANTAFTIIPHVPDSYRHSFGGAEVSLVATDNDPNIPFS